MSPLDWFDCYELQDSMPVIIEPLANRFLNEIGKLQRLSAEGQVISHETTLDRLASISFRNFCKVLNLCQIH